jgi:hypothetical protein
MRILFVLSVWLWMWLAVGAQAQEPARSEQLPDAPAPNAAPSKLIVRQDNPGAPPERTNQVVFHKNIYWTLVVVDAGSAVADAQTGWNIEQSTNGYEENSWLYGRKPSLARYYLTDLATDGGSAVLSYVFLHSRHRWLRVAGWCLPAGAIAGHTDGWIYNITRHQTLLPAPTGAQ